VGRLAIPLHSIIQTLEQAPRTAPVILAGTCAFLNLYSTQPLLPLLENVFRASHIAVSLTITAATFGVAIAAPFAGRVADGVGRKRVIVCSAALLALTSIAASTATTLNWLIFWRFLQGVITPGIFGVTIAYINDEWPPARAASAVGSYVSGTVVGGFSGRISAGFIAQYLGWRWVFILLGGLVGFIALFLALGLPPETRFRRDESRSDFIATALAHLRNKRLLAVYSIGFCVLGTQVALFTYVTFYLAGPPFRLSPGALGAIFCVYLVGAAVTPFAGRAIDIHGHRPAVLFAALIGAAGALITLIPNLHAILLGLTLCSTGVFIANSASTSFIGTVAGKGRALAVGLYVTFYYAGASAGSSGPAGLWQAYGWPGCVALIVAVQAALAALAWFGLPALSARPESPRNYPPGR
jgi:MFS family permease